MLPKPMKFFPFGDVPDRNHSYCHQADKIFGYVIRGEDNKIELYRVVGKSAATRSHYRVTRIEDGVALASIDEEQLENKYVIRGTHDQELANITISQGSMKLTLENGNSYNCKLSPRAKSFEFKDTDSNLVITIDKKSLSLNDSYHTVHITDFPALVARLLPVIIDDVFHKGPNN